MFMVAGGRLHPVADADLARFIGYPNADFGVLDYLALNHLAVIVRTAAQSIDLSLNVRDFDPRNIRAVIDYLARNHGNRDVRIRRYSGKWVSERFAASEQAIAHLRQIAARELPPPSELEPPRVSAGAVSRLGRPHPMAGAANSAVERDRAGLLGCILAVTENRREGSIVSFIAPGIDILAARQEWARRLRASPSNENVQADRRMIPDRGAAALPDGRLDRRDAMLALSQSRPVRPCYGRRLAPAANLDGRPLVIGYSVSSGDIALPL
jgi:hypothetical protein